MNNSSNSANIDCPQQDIIISCGQNTRSNLKRKKSSTTTTAKRKLEKTCSSTPRNQRSFLYRSSNHIISYIEWLCGLWGYVVARHPWTAVLTCLILSSICGGGLYYLTFEYRPYKLWVKEPSEFKEVHEWKMKNFPNTIRKHVAIWENKNILTADAIKQMWKLHQKVRDSSSSKNHIKYTDVCLRVPSLISNTNSEDDVTYDYESYDDVLVPSLPAWLQERNSEDKTSKFSGMSKRSSEDKTSKLGGMSKRSSEDKTSNFGGRSERNAEFPNGEVSPEYSYDDYLLDESSKLSVGEIPWLANFKTDNSNPDSDRYLSPSQNDSLEERNEHCKYVEELDLICYEESLLEVWGYNDEVIKSLTDASVLKDINGFSKSRVTGFPKDIASYLGGIERNHDGHIVAAKGALYTWYTKVDMDAIRECERPSCKVEIDLGSGEEVDEKGMEWEIHLTSIVEEFKGDGMPINLQASYLFGAIHRSALFEDSYWVGLGWILLIFYVILTLGKPFSKDSRIMPIVIGIFCVALSVMASYGLCTASGIPYGPLNTVLPILLIALGVDDMYVIMNAWDSIKHQNQDITFKIRKSLNKAGLAVTVTSLTDVIAFIIGATTKVPALRYFCMYAAVGIAIVYILQITMFVAGLVLCEKHKENKKRNDSKGCLPNFIQERFGDDEHNREFLGKWMGKWVKFLLKPPATAFVLLITGFTLGAALSQTLELEQKFDSVWLLPKSSDLYQWFQRMDQIFPKDGREGFIFFENVNLPEELPELQKLTKELKNNVYVSRVDAWFEELLTFIEKEDLFKDKLLTKGLFNDALSYFLFNGDGAKYRNDIVFDENVELNCSQPAPEYTTFKINFQYVRLNQALDGEAQNAMNAVRELVANANISGYRAPWALSYGQWETDDIISHELLRNVLVVLVIVFVMTMVLLASVRAALLVLVCVLATLLDVAALMSFWGLTINTVSCIALVIAIGICVDYAAHITHGFLVAQGSRRFRAQSALRHMGPAVLHGGVSTLIAFVLLGPADTFVFISYFKILTGVAVFGLYHAIILLPILLALLGPPPYGQTENESKSSEDSHSCSTESTTTPCTPNFITPVATPQPIKPNCSFTNNNGSFEDDKSSAYGDEASHSDAVPYPKASPCTAASDSEASHFQASHSAVSRSEALLLSKDSHSRPLHSKASHLKVSDYPTSQSDNASHLRVSRCKNTHFQASHSEALHSKTADSGGTEKGHEELADIVVHSSTGQKSRIGHQALKNMTLPKTSHLTEKKLDQTEVKESETLGNVTLLARTPRIDKENVLKLYIKNS